jgi:hypothetical protein
MVGKVETIRTRWAGLIAEIKEASQLLPECKRREANQVAHGLAQLAARQQQPSGIQTLVVNDTRYLVSSNS